MDPGSTFQRDYQTKYDIPYYWQSPDLCTDFVFNRFLARRTKQQPLKYALLTEKTTN
jgi:hypothetical protein